MKSPQDPPEATRDSDDHFAIIDDPVRLADLQGWTKEVYADFLALQSGVLSKNEFREKYLHTRAILVLDMTGFTQSSLQEGQIESLLRIFDTQKIAIPVLYNHQAIFVRAFADDLVALFDDVSKAFDAALEIHRRIKQFSMSSGREVPTQCCIGIGYGRVYAIGPNLAQGTEMNLASKLGEDIARGGETLVTEQAYEALRERADIAFDRQIHDELDVAFFRAGPAS